MKWVYVLKMRLEGDYEDQILLFDDIRKVSDAVFEFFDMEEQRSRGLDGFQFWLMDKDIGYFDVSKRIQAYFSR